MQRISVKTVDKIQILDISDQVHSSIKIRSGCIVLFVPHTTAGIIVNENEGNLKKNLVAFYGKLAKGDWAHNKIDNNAEAHLAATAIGNSVMVPVTEGEPALGTWQSIMFVELDGPRERQVYIKELGK